MNDGVPGRRQQQQSGDRPAAPIIYHDQTFLCDRTLIDNLL